MLLCPDIFAASDKLLLHRRFTLRRARHSSAAQLVSLEIMDGTYESIYLAAFILAGPVYNNALTNRAALLSPGDPLLPSGNSPCAAPSVELPICVAVRYLTLRKGGERYGRKKSSAVPLFAAVTCSNLRQIRKQGKGRSSKRKENRRLSFLFAPAAGVANSRAPQSATPSLNLSEKPPAR